MSDETKQKPTPETDALGMLQWYIRACNRRDEANARADKAEAQLTEALNEAAALSAERDAANFACAEANARAQVAEAELEDLRDTYAWTISPATLEHRIDTLAARAEKAETHLDMTRDLLRQAMEYCPDGGELSGCAMSARLRQACETAVGGRQA